MSGRTDGRGRNRSLRADESYCTSCGEIIKTEAELCPHCGVRNDTAGVGRSTAGRSAAASTRGAQTSTTPASTTGAGTGTGSGTRQSDGYETTVSDTWWYGVAGFAAAWVLLLVVPAAIGIDLGAFGGLIALVAWIGLPLSVYFDMKYVRANSDWNPNPPLWVLGSLIWFINVVVGAVYLYRRHEVLGEP